LSTLAQKVKGGDDPLSDASIEADLLRRIGEGERGAFDKLYARYSRPLFSYIVKFLRDRSLAEETLQDVFVKIWKTAARYDPTLSRPFSWAVLVTKRLCIDKLRRLKPVTVMEDPTILQSPEDQSANIPSPSASAALLDEVDCLRTMLKKLPDGQRASLSLAMDKGMTQQEISDALNMPLGTVKTAMRRGMQRLKQLMSHCYE